MGKVKQEAETRCELALMGKVVPVNSNDEVQFMTEYILSAMGHDEPLIEDFVSKTINHYGLNYVKYLVCTTVEDMKCITYLLESASDDDGEQYPAPVEEDYGTGYPCAFCYVFNTDVDWCSEFGDCFFEKRADGFYHRVS